jgi:hypothetical protein
MITQPMPYDCRKITVLRTRFLKENLFAVGNVHRRYPFQADRAYAVSMSHDFMHDNPLLTGCRMLGGRPVQCLQFLYTSLSIWSAHISDIATWIDSSDSRYPRRVASMSMVVLLPIPTIEAISIPPLRMILSLDLESAILSNKRSNIKF